jgi:hypothetical protein
VAEPVFEPLPGNIVPGRRFVIGHA